MILAEKLQFPTDFSQKKKKNEQALFNNSVVMEDCVYSMALTCA